ncbi:MAG: uracil-DNA glycosylase [Candidatus Odyssella sp.]|nr:uracil-DNA glycosylase [Candidatus Odyssella sp.]
MPARDMLRNALLLQIEAGADEAIAEAPVDRFAQRPPSPAPAAPAPAAAARPAPPAAARPAPTPVRVTRPAAPAALVTAETALGAARAAALAAPTLADLRAAVEAFEGCQLKETATHTVFADGAEGAPAMFVGEAPGADEDRIGKPFVGVSGQLLDRMIATIGLSRSLNAYITNILFWRPPGNREPSSEEIALCLPFVMRHIELARPKVLVFLGGPSAKTLLGRAEGITRLRGRWQDFRTQGMLERGEPPIAAMAMFHPAYLLRTPGAKREAWRDLMAIRARLAEAGALG